MGMRVLQYRFAGRIVVAFCGLGVLLGASYWSCRLAYAGLLSSYGSAYALADATRLAPGDAQLWRRYAGTARRIDADEALRHTVALNPRDSSTWIELGLLAESRRSFDAAERCYLEAARASRRFQPSWTLANYYFRRQNDKAFRVWAVRALGMVYGDATPLFQLCWTAAPGPGLVIGAIEGRRDLIRQYLAFLSAQGKLDAADRAARSLLQSAQKEDLPVLLAYCSRLLEAGAVAPALEVWNELSRERAIPYGVLDPDHVAALTNGSFEIVPFSLGFDWRLVPWTGIRTMPLSPSDGLRLTFDGNQPESCEMLTQLVPVTPGKPYRLGYESQTPGVGKETGLHWSVLHTVTGAVLESSAELSSEAWQHGEMRFTAPADSPIVRLALIYRRTHGTSPTVGALWLRRISLD